jgi:hypothetical protein
VESQVAQPSGSLEKYISAVPSQTENLAARRAVSMSVYILAGAIVILALATIGILFFDRPA